MDQELAIRAATPDDWEATSRLVYSAFNFAFDEDESNADRGVYEPERALVVADGDRLVGHSATFTRDLTVPGAIVPAAHVTGVGVAPTHRRRGIMRRLMERQLRDARAAGEPVAILWATEGRIYQRFGYGLAAAKLAFEVDAREVSLAGPAPGTLRDADPASVRTEIIKVYDEVRADRPGWSSRDARWWEHVLSDLPSRRRGMTELRATLHEGQSGVDGYALWRVKASWEPNGPNGEVHVAELAAVGPTAYAALWRFLLSVDLTRTTHFRHGAVDEPLLYLANEPRRLGARFGDALWLRVLDVGAALSARQYAAPVDVVIDVADDLIAENAGRWRLSTGAAPPGGAGLPGGALPGRAVGSGGAGLPGGAVGSGGARLPGGAAVRTDAPADLACDISVLGAAYLGGASLGALAAAGRLDERTPGALAAADAALGWHRAPISIEIF